MYVIFFSEFEQLGWPPSSKIERKAFRMFAFFIRRLELRNFTMLTKPDSDQPLSPSSFSEVEASSLHFCSKIRELKHFYRANETARCLLQTIGRNGVTNGFKPGVSEDAIYSGFFRSSFCSFL